MPKYPLPILTLIAFSTISAGCASPGPAYVAPPRLTLPAVATQSCSLDLLPEAPTYGDLKASYAKRGEGLVLCDAARDLAVQTLLSERSLIDQWLEMQRAKNARWIWSR